MTDLSAPLRRRRKRQEKVAGQRLLRRLPIAAAAFGLLGLIAAVVIGTVVLVDNPTGGRPSTTVDVNASASTNAIAEALSGGNLPATISADPEMIPVPGPTVDVADATPIDPAALSPDLLEQTEFGAIPRVSATGVTPFRAYGRSDPGVTPANLGKPSIAIIVSGLGLNPSGTSEAIQKLPEAVTLAFAPYGKNLERTVADARTAGHEIFLEVPLEPFDYPENDPGPDTLLTGQAPRDNLEKLFKVMGRFGGYVGLLNNMGARFTSSSVDFSPVMEELGTRGLGYLDDGSSNRSIAQQLAKANGVPFARVNTVIDVNPARAPILAQLKVLEELAKANGSAIGIISALPVSIDVVSEWARDLADKGIEIVPASALMENDDA
jgi:polysaccharide deacetylase 2 family uncharacterized protein YibQ